jgi:pimeloyl-ACP methyl ester carboxylesterase
VTELAARVDVPVQSGTLATFRLGSLSPDAPVALAIHGLTSSSRSWLATGRALDDQATLIAVDLRGRSRSNHLPRPFGIAAHVRDMVAVLDHFDLRRAVIAGHSLGAYIAAALATAHPDRVSGLVLVDGGLTIPDSVGVDPQQFLEEFLGASLARLQMTFPDWEDYRAWWAAHPAFGDSDVDPAELAEYADHDLEGEPPELRSSVNPEAVRADSIDVFAARDAQALAVPAVVLCAPRGMVDDPNPMQPLPLVQAWAADDPQRRRAVEVPDCNHYTIALGRHGARVVAGEIVAALANIRPPEVPR